MLTVGSLFSGYGGLDLAVKYALGPTRTAWVSDVEPGPNAILAQRFPGVPNLGDITAIDWTQVEPVDIIAGGSPCQDLSAAGQRRGMRPGTRSGLWESMAQAIKTLRPSLVIWENVHGALSAPAFSLMESETGRLGDGPTGPILRAPGRVLGDLANIGYDARWQIVRASDVGAPHRRARLFIIAYPHDNGLEGGFTGRALSELPRTESNEPLLPTPSASQGGSIRTTESEYADLGRTLYRLLPTPTAERPDGRKSDAFREGRTTFYDVVELNQWDDYAPAVHQWEQVLGRSAPEPTEPSRTGKPQLSPAFVEWMMGLPEGWVTDVNISRATQLRALGNGVVPQQGAAAITQLLGGAA